MNSKHYVGKRVSSLELYDEIGPVTGVALLIDGENEILSGDETGYVLEITCPYGTQTMADNILEGIQGKSYQGYRAHGAVLDPLAEQGDGITVGGEYSLLAYRSVNFGPGHMSEIAAPGESTLEHEYSYETPAQRELDRKIAQTRSLISKTAEEIRLDVQNEVDGLSASFTVQLDAITARVDGLDGQYTEVSTTLDGLTVTDASGTTKIRGSSIETDSLYVNAANISGTLTASQINTDGLTVNAANITGTLTIGQLPSTVAETSDIPTKTSQLTNNSGYVNSSGVLAVTEDAGYVDETGVVSIIDGTVTADYVEALGITVKGTLSANYVDVSGLLAVYYGSSVYGYIGASTASTALGTGVAVCDSSCSNGLLAMTTGVKMMYGNTNNQVYVIDGSVGITADGSYYYFDPDRFVSADGNILGTSSAPWSVLYADSCSCCTSDREKKNSIVYDIDERYDRLWELLKPCTGKYNNGTSDRTHMYLISQDVGDAIEAAGLTSQDFAAYIKAPKTDKEGNVIEGYDYALRYEEFIPLCIRQIQKMQARVAELEAKTA